MPTSSESSTASCTTKRDMTMESMITAEMKRTKDGEENEDKINEILEFSKMRCRLQSTA